MAQVCGECGASNRDGDRFCRTCGKPLAGSLRSTSDDALSNEQRAVGPLAAVALIGALLLCCLGIIGVALLNELMPTHPFQTLLVGAPTPKPTCTLAPTSTVTPTVTPVAAFQPASDSFEPDNTTAQANEITTDGRSQTHTLSPADDRDYVFFQTRQGMAYTVETGNLGGDCDTVLSLHDEDGTKLATDDDGGGEAWASRLVWVADEDARLAVEVTQYGQGADGEATQYDIWVLESEPVIFDEDEYEPDDTMAQANEILLDVPQTHNIHILRDHDWVFFQAEDGVSYNIETSNLGSELDTIIYLYDATGEELAQDDDGGEESLASRIIWAADSTGALYVMIRDYWGNRIESEMQYNISVAEITPVEADAYEPDDTQDEASEIEVGLHQTHNI